MTNDLDQLIPEAMLRATRVLTICGLKKTALYTQVQKGNFPPPVELTPNGGAVAWRREDVIAWLNSRPSTVKDKEGQ